MILNRLKPQIFIFTAALFFYALDAQAQVLEKCEILDEINNITVSNEEFDLLQAVRNHEVEFCVFGADIDLYRVDPIKSKDSVSYTVLQQICAGLTQIDSRNTSDLHEQRNITVDCKFEGTHTWMCLEQKFDCEKYARSNYMRTSNVSTNEVEPIIDFIDEFRVNRTISLGRESVKNKMSLEALKWIFESKHEFQILSIKFEDYAEQNIVSSGRFEVVAVQGSKFWSAIISPSSQGLSLIGVGFIDK